MKMGMGQILEIRLLKDNLQLHRLERKRKRKIWIGIGEEILETEGGGIDRVEDCVMMERTVRGEVEIGIRCHISSQLLIVSYHLWECKKMEVRLKMKSGKVEVEGGGIYYLIKLIIEFMDYLKETLPLHLSNQVHLRVDLDFHRIRLNLLRGSYR
jgi:hypothetical protein